MRNASWRKRCSTVPACIIPVGAMSLNQQVCVASRPSTAVNALDKNQLSPLMLSVLDSREQVVPALLGAGADPNTAAQARVLLECSVHMKCT